MNLFRKMRFLSIIYVGNWLHRPMSFMWKFPMNINYLIETTFLKKNIKKLFQSTQRTYEQMPNAKCLIGNNCLRTKSWFWANYPKYTTYAHAHPPENTVLSKCDIYGIDKAFNSRFSNDDFHLPLACEPDCSYFHVSRAYRTWCSVAAIASPCSKKRNSIKMIIHIDRLVDKRNYRARIATVSKSSTCSISSGANKSQVNRTSTFTLWRTAAVKCYSKIVYHLIRKYS